jgi:protein-tyrosine phosphatase
MRDFMVETYRRVPYEERHEEVFGQALRAVAAGDAPVVIHCAAGKDRTGILCGLLLDALGVSEGAIEADYLRTNAMLAAEGEASLSEYASKMFEAFGKEVTPEALRPMLGVELDYLHAAWEVMAREDGGRTGYLDRIGVDEDVRAALRARLVG